ncbi:MAG: helix-turn-helix domain-containing protein [Nitrospiraceae bacterium]|nr:helix-turn-helix domain-containing protein [Nitrospiraceae bacterium]
MREAVEVDRKSDTAPLTREEAATYLRVHPDTLYTWATEGRVAYSRLGDGKRAALRFLRRDLDRFVSGHRIDTIEATRRHVKL